MTENGFALENPYFDAVARGVTVGTDREPDLTDKVMRTFRRRVDLVDEYAWGIPNMAAIKTIIDYEPILEVGAGNGYWTYLLRQADADVIATDLNAPFDNEWSPVWAADAREVVVDYPDRTLLMVWPSNGQSWPTEALGAYDGDVVVYVGEGRGGATADEGFHQMLHEEWEVEKAVAVPAYLGIRDRLEVWTQ